VPLEPPFPHAKALSPKGTGDPRDDRALRVKNLNYFGILGFRKSWAWLLLE